jgi:hypothetical protein
MKITLITAFLALAPGLCMAAPDTAQNYIIPLQPLNSQTALDPAIVIDMLEHIEFITKWTVLKYNGEQLPDVHFVDSDQLQLLYYTQEMLLNFERTGMAVPLVAAFYDINQNEIVLTNNYDKATDTSLFHELVHYLQMINGKSDMFINNMICLEAEAYDLQSFWQQQTSTALETAPQYGYIMTLYSVCNGPSFK